VYSIFVRIFTILFGDYFDVAVIAFQSLLGICGIYLFFQKTANVFKLNLIFKILLLAVLIFPYFPPLSIAKNITSEGLAYPFYLLVLAFSFDLIFRDKTKKLIPLSICFILLTLTRGQFIIVVPILAFIYFLKHKRNSFNKPVIFILLTLVSLPLVTQTINKSYNKIKYGHFVSTPYSFVNIVALPLFVSNKDDAASIKNEADRDIFIKSYNQIDSLGLLSSKVAGGTEDEYMLFHKNFPVICNQNILQHGIDYYNEKHGRIAATSVEVEQTCKRLTPILIKNNLSEYVTIYFEGLFHGFKSVFIAIFIVLVLLYSLWLNVKNFTTQNATLLLSSLLIVSNAMIVAVACHSIDRYLFYNYCLGLLILIILYKKVAVKL